MAVGEPVVFHTRCGRLEASVEEGGVIALDFPALPPREVTARGVIGAARGRDHDVVSRFFAPGAGVDEDPVTGSAHCVLDRKSVV